MTREDFADHPAWEYATDEEGIDGRDETWMRPVSALPVPSLDGLVVGATVRLANGRALPASLGNIDLRDVEATKLLLTLSVFDAQGQVFHLARYHDRWVDAFGPDALASFLGLSIDEIFPISYDVSALVSVPSDSSRGVITREPEVRLSRRDVLAVVMRRRRAPP